MREKNTDLGFSSSTHTDGADAISWKRLYIPYYSPVSFPLDNSNKSTDALKDKGNNTYLYELSENFHYDYSNSKVRFYDKCRARPSNRPWSNIQRRQKIIAITGGSIDGPRLTGKVLSGGGDWNAVRPDGVVHVFAKYSIQASDGTPISITNEGLNWANQSSK
ncbi:uncharacterized protein BO96DRAFT_437586 [Aspergillus niger CBS 101883]|uniref:uncharacterized protein n=1 Tax=Aspergillus lacticoffeatus (strain CBS 101883) TaxID=1450533 RepID=UPI000D7F37E7|nr:uncharacterized protein BO96DRAFT_437586 [Aspergillus niger CBS 101883]PYH52979.1 hypothetical protein BO96DRAFT_437586 [Aspergillus niger CBS 101883]